MQCSIQGCPGAYEERHIIHAVRHQGGIVVIDGVPAEVCTVCADTLLSPETVLHIERLLEDRAAPVGAAPLYRYA